MKRGGLSPLLKQSRNLTAKLICTRAISFVCVWRYGVCVWGCVCMCAGMEVHTMVHCFGVNECVMCGAGK